jgi:hypothetical protein
MRIRARAALLCAAALLVPSLVPAGAAAQTPISSFDNTVWPSASDGTPIPTNPDLVSPGPCDPADGTRTLTFSHSGPGITLNADGTFTEQGSFTIARVDGILRVVDFDSTFSGASSKGTVTGERHLRESLIAQTTARCTGTSDADRTLEIVVPRAHTEVTVTFPSGAGGVDRGWTRMQLSTFSTPRRTGNYFSHYSSDLDGDEIRNIEDNCRFVPNPDQANSDGDTAGDACDADIDGDGRANASDNCQYVPNVDQADRDGDGIGDVCDPVDDVQEDSDGDEVVDDADNCVDVPNPDQTDTGGTPLGDACEDRDGDAVGDLVDNCVDVANGDQANLDADALGDTCDADDDADTIADASDNCPLAPNPAQRDSDADGLGDACDGAFDSNDGFAGGGGKLAGGVYFSVALHSGEGTLHGSGHLASADATVRLLDVSGLRSDGDRVVAVGHASIDGAPPVDYRLEIADEPDAFALEVAGRTWAGVLVNGNVVVR